MDVKKILAACDHTLLHPDSTPAQIRELCGAALHFQTAAVCIPPCFVRMAKEYLRGRIPVCTVIGFPNGNMMSAVKEYEARAALMDGADEIDMVINVGMLKAGEDDYVRNEIERIREICSNHILKVIVEACLLSEDEKIRICRIVTEAGADFIKTSTGFSHGGATFEDVRLFAENVGPSVQIKAAGGIDSLENAQRFMELGASRLGTSRIVNIVKTKKARKV